MVLASFVLYCTYLVLFCDGCNFGIACWSLLSAPLQGPQSPPRRADTFNSSAISLFFPPHILFIGRLLKQLAFYERAQISFSLCLMPTAENVKSREQTIQCLDRVPIWLWKVGWGINHSMSDFLHSKPCWYFCNIILIWLYDVSARGLYIDGCGASTVAA